MNFRNFIKFFNEICVHGFSLSHITHTTMKTSPNASCILHNFIFKLTLSGGQCGGQIHQPTNTIGNNGKALFLEEHATDNLLLLSENKNQKIIDRSQPNLGESIKNEILQQQSKSNE
jgi:hypothetical protein